MATSPIPVSQFAAKIRQNFPGSYDDMKDDDLVFKIISKYPQYKDMIAPNDPGEMHGPVSQSVIDSARKQEGNYMRTLGTATPAGENISSGRGPQVPTSASGDVLQPPGMFNSNQVLPTLGTMIGGAAGVAAGAAAGGVGAVPGAIAGAGVGSGAGTLANQALGHVSPFYFGAPPTTGTEAAKEEAGSQAMGALAEAGGQAVNTVADLLAPAARRAAARVYEKVLQPVGNEAKYLAQKIAPGLADSGIIAMTEGGFKKAVSAQLDAAGIAFDSAISKIRPDAPVNTAPVVQAMTDYQKAFMVPGTNPGVPGNQQAVAAASAELDKLKQIISQQGQSISFESYQGLKRILGESVASAKGYAGKDLAEGTVLDARKEMADAMRRELADQFPDLAKVNAEYSLWSSANKLADASIRRSVGQQAVGPSVAAAAGAAGSIAHGDSPGDIAQHAMLMAMLYQAMRSTGWRTVSAQGRMAIADALAKPTAKEATVLLGRVLQGQSIENQSMLH